ncbi:MAG: glycoside hydrolase family 3 C-terminal domain-containing protein [Oscillospiraceae bacterium]|nr:glycoside hydrolase family 3 C-terminal domain-containing protein [Oscillospiraceae bacterium]
MLYKNPNIPEEQRVEDLLARMTIEEKIAQLVMSRSMPELIKMLDDGTFPEHGVSSCYNGNVSVPPEDFNRLHKYVLENTRLGIPLSVHGESLHGVMLNGATVFPQAIGLGSTFNTELMSEIVNIIGAEANILGIRQTYAPNLDLSRDPRWGRVEENYGEDPYLTSRLGVAYIKALQSHDVASSPKHYVAHGSPEGGLNLAPVHAGEREFRDTMLEPFRAAVTEAKAMSMMPAYSELDGVPIHASRFLLTDVLRDELGFDGYTVSDFGAVYMLHTLHKVAKTPMDAGIITLNAGIDHEAPGAYGFGQDFIEAAKNGLVPMEQIDEAVRRTLRIKFRLGLFEDPYMKPEKMHLVHNETAINATRRTAHESIVLLKNNGILPLSDNIGSVAVIGPNADVAQVGDYTATGGVNYTVTLKQGLINRLGEERVNYAKGTHINTEKDIEEAVNAVNKSDVQVVIVVLGENSNYYGGVFWGDDSGGNVVTCGEGFDNHTLLLPPVQRKLLETVAELGKPVILVLETGRPFCIEHECNLSDAVFQAWYPGEQGGNALCDLIFGDVNPSGRLPITFPRSVGHVPCFYNHKPSARGIYHVPGSPEKSGRDYVFDKPDPLFPFGFGLSYTTFEYSDLKADRNTVSVTVTNTGDRAGKEAVLMFIRQHYAPITPFVKRLRKFDKIMLQPGESKVVTFELIDEDFSFINADMKYEVGSGTFSIMIGGLECEIELP